MSDFATAWEQLDAPFRSCLTQAWLSMRRRGLPVGAAVSRGGEIVSVGRNRVYDPPGGDDPLQRTAIAHAEMNALASAGDAIALDDCELWSTHEPCRMCAGAAAFTDIAAVHYLATDPSSRDNREPYRSSGRSDSLWTVVANTLFLHNIAWVGGAESPIVQWNQQREPDVTSLALDLVAEATLVGGLAPVEFAEAMTALWPRLTATADRRRGARRTD